MVVKQGTCAGATDGTAERSKFSIAFIQTNNKFGIGFKREAGCFIISLAVGAWVPILDYGIDIHWLSY